MRFLPLPLSAIPGPLFLGYFTPSLPHRSYRTPLSALGSAMHALPVGPGGVYAARHV